MTEREFDNCLNEVFLRAAAKRFDAVSTEDLPPLSWKCRRQCAKMLADPRKFALRYHEPWEHRLQRWAVTAALLLVLCGYAMFLVPQLRVWAVNILSSWHEEYLEYSFTYKGATDELTLPEIEVTYVPQGYVLVYDEIWLGLSRSFDYDNAEKVMLNIDVAVVRDGMNWYFDNEHQKMQYVNLADGTEARLLEAVEEGRTSSLVWTNKEGTIAFSIVGHLPKEEMLKIANGIICK